LVESKAKAGQIIENDNFTNKYLSEINSILDKELFELVLVNKVNSLFSSVYKFNEIITSLFNLLEKTIDFQFASILITENEKVDLFLETPFNPKREVVQDIRQRTLNTLPRSIQDLIDDDKISVELFSKDKGIELEKDKFELGSFLSIPVKVRANCYLVLAIGHINKNVFGEQVMNILEILCRQAAIVIDNAKLYRQVQEERNIVDAIVQSATEGILVTDSKDRIISLNIAAKRIFGIKEGMLELPQGIKDFVFTPLLKEFSQQNRNMMVKEIDLSVPSKMTLRIEMAPLRDISGEKFGVVTMIHDITKRKEIDRMKTEFVSTVSHELRTPLTTMKEFISIMLDGIPGPVNEEQRNYLQIVKNNITRLTRIINNLLDISKIESGKVEFRKEKTSFAKIINQELPNFKTQAETKGINLEVNIPVDLPDVFVDTDKIIQVLTNLVGNAVKFTPSDGTIRINVGRRGDFIQSSVEDSGVGISKENLDKVFDKFTQLDRQPGTGEKGTGLGLTITRSILLLHRGKIWVESEIGLGTKFIFTLPVYKEELGYVEQLAGQIRYAHDSQKELYLFAVCCNELTSFCNKIGKNPKQLSNELEASIRNIVQGKVSHMFHYRFKDDVEMCVVVIMDMNEQQIFKLKDSIKNSLLAFKQSDLEYKDMKLDFSKVSYPQDGIKAEDLIEKAKESLESFV